MPCLCNHIRTLETKIEKLQEAVSLLSRSSAVIDNARSQMQMAASAYNYTVRLGSDMGVAQLVSSKGFASANAVAVAIVAVNTQLARTRTEVCLAKDADRIYHRRLEEEERRRRAEQERAEALAEKQYRAKAVK